MDKESRVSFLIDNLTQANIDNAIFEYLHCEDVDDFSKYESHRGFSKPKNYLYTRLGTSLLDQKTDGDCILSAFR